VVGTGGKWLAVKWYDIACSLPAISVIIVAASIALSEPMVLSYLVVASFQCAR
jgi:hypothetical protein